jgi:hypothetical protein
MRNPRNDRDESEYAGAIVGVMESRAPRSHSQRTIGRLLFARAEINRPAMDPAPRL